MNPVPSNEFSALLTRENITLALSIFGATGTLITFISSFITKRKNLRIKISDSVYNRIIKTLTFVVSFENRSHLPIAVTSVSFLLDGTESLPVKYPRCVEQYAHRQGKDVIDRKFLYNLNFPIDIQQLSSVSGHILLAIPQEELEKLSTPVIVQVHSTRGRVQQIKLPHDSIRYC